MGSRYGDPTELMIIMVAPLTTRPRLLEREAPCHTHRLQLLFKLSDAWKSRSSQPPVRLMSFATECAEPMPTSNLQLCTKKAERNIREAAGACVACAGSRKQRWPCGAVVSFGEHLAT